MRKNILSKLMIMVIISILTLAMGIPTFANTSSKLDIQLTKMGVPNEVINSMGDAQKNDIISKCIKFVGFSKGALNENTSTSSTTDGSIIPMGTIPSGQMNQYFTVYSTQRSSDNRKRFILYQNWRWTSTNMPLVRLTDPFGMAWSSNWRAVPNTSFYQMTYNVTLNGPDDHFVSDSALAYAASNGCGWNANLPYAAYNSLYGFGEITIEAMVAGGGSGSDQLMANYNHVTFGTGIGLAFGPISCSFSGSANYDSQGIYQNFNY